MKGLLRLLAMFAVMLAARAQVSDQVRQATVTGSGGSSGKCTIEVRVDMTAEVDVYGDSGRLRTLAGQPATWTRMVCTSPLPYRMTDFRFRGIDGRGTQQLVQDPRNNNSIAVIRIEDPRSGSEGYTFDIEWSGGSGGYASNGFATMGASPGRPGSPATGPGGVLGSRRGAGQTISAERALDLCRAEVHARGQRDYGLTNIDITAVGLDTGQGRRNWVTGTFTEGAGGFASAGGYRFNCSINFTSGQVLAVELLRGDGSALRPGAASGAYGAGGYNQTQVLRACQDAVVARVNQAGYQNIQFGSTGLDTRRSGWVTGTVTGSRVLVTDTFDFGCSMDLGAARVLDVQLTRR
ncbi:MAG: hypothetical protein IT159_09055 [Bryobacterales bacterium]|nr:hypothetical protein [Bryobacterales bacterium]